MKKLQIVLLGLCLGGVLASTGCQQHNASVRKRFGKREMRLGKYDDAINSFTESLEEDKNSESYFWRGLAYGLTGQHSAAVTDFTKVIELSPDDSRAYANRGTAYLEQKKYELAIDDFTKAIEFGQQDSELHHIYYMRGKAYQEISEYQKAAEDFRISAELKRKK